MDNTYLFTSESVSEGHPDKVADQVSDAVVDAYLAVDPSAKVACETLITKGRVIIAGEVFVNNGHSVESIEDIVRGVIARIGYVDERLGFDSRRCRFENYLHAQSCNIRDCVEQLEMGRAEGLPRSGPGRRDDPLKRGLPA